MDEKYPTVSYEEVNKLKSDSGCILIDVREPSELLKYGSIPGSINIPLNDVETALTELSPSEFKEKYGREKPSKDAKLIFTCQIGKRSRTAQEKAITLGYKNVYNYFGSWLDWEKHTKGKGEN